MLRDHLDECEDCQQVASWMSSVDGLARGGPAAPRPNDTYFAGVRSSVMAKVQAASQEPAARTASRRMWLRWPILAPTALAVVLVGLLTVRQSEHTQTLDQLATAPKRAQSVEDAASPAQRQPAEEKEDAQEPRADTDTRAPAPAAVGLLDKDQTVDSRRQKSLVQGFDEAAKVERPMLPTASVPSALPTPKLAESSLPLRQVFELALASQDTPGEPRALTQLLEALEGTEVDSGRDAAPSYELSSGARAEASFRQTVRERAALATATTLADSIAVHLEERTAALQDTMLRARITAWLQSR